MNFTTRSGKILLKAVGAGDLVFVAKEYTELSNIPCDFQIPENQEEYDDNKILLDDENTDQTADQSDLLCDTVDKELPETEPMETISFKNKKTDTEGNTVNWLKIKALKFSQIHPGIMQYEYLHEGQYKNILIGGKGGKGRPCKRDVTLKKAYGKNLPITTLKYENSMVLCAKNAIPPEYHRWYKSLTASPEIANANPGSSI